jgi:hypothetical protein
MLCTGYVGEKDDGLFKDVVTINLNVGNIVEGACPGRQIETESVLGQRFVGDLLN